MKLKGLVDAVMLAVPYSHQKARGKQRSYLQMSHVPGGQGVKVGGEKTPGLCPLTTGNENCFTGKPWHCGKRSEQKQCATVRCQ